MARKQVNVRDVKKKKSRRRKEGRKEGRKEERVGGREGGRKDGLIFRGGTWQKVLTAPDQHNNEVESWALRLLIGLEHR